MKSPLYCAQLIKLALNRETKLRRSGFFSPADDAHLLEFHRANYTPGQRERLIRHLGQGATSNVDLVFHPQYGYQARKALRANVPMTDIATDPNMQIWHDVKAYQDKHGPSGFAPVREVTPEGLIFQDVAKGPDISNVDPHWAHAQNLNDTRLRMEQNADRIMRKYPGTVGESLADRLMTAADNFHRKMTLPAVRRARAPLPPARLPSGLPQMMESLRRKYPDVYDYNSPWNVHQTARGPVSIDVSANRSGVRGNVPAYGNVSTRVNPTSNQQFLARKDRILRALLRRV